MQYSTSSISEDLIKHLFVGLLILVQNSLMLGFYTTLSLKEKQYRYYEKPAAIIPKPKIKESSTMIEEGGADVKWHTFKLKIYKLKYEIVEECGEYLCYRCAQDDQ